MAVFYASGSYSSGTKVSGSQSIKATGGSISISATQYGSAGGVTSSKSYSSSGSGSLSIVQSSSVSSPASYTSNPFSSSGSTSYSSGGSSIRVKQSGSASSGSEVKGQIVYVGPRASASIDSSSSAPRVAQASSNLSPSSKRRSGSKGLPTGSRSYSTPWGNVNVSFQGRRVEYSTTGMIAARLGDKASGVRVFPRREAF